jgi:riboflavin biosynthesis pyrimidine reductase
MEQSEASLLVANVDEQDHDGRTERLVELTELLPDDGMVGFSGNAAQWLFEDVKATWLYGCFASTVLTAHAFCSLQIAGAIRMLADDPRLPNEAESLEQLAAIAVEAGALDVERQARLLELHDRYRLYTSAHLHEYEARLERHMVEVAIIGTEHHLLSDARLALVTSVSLVYR